MNTQENTKNDLLKNPTLMVINIVVFFAEIAIITSFWTWAKNVFPYYNIPNTNLRQSYDYKVMQATYALTSYLALIGILISIAFFFVAVKYINRNHEI